MRLKGTFRGQVIPDHKKNEEPTRSFLKKKKTPTGEEVLAFLFIIELLVSRTLVASVEIRT
jgi:hypothetical protein